MKYVLLGIGGKELEITIDESAKDDFKQLMGWTEEEFQSRTKKIIQSSEEEN